MAESTIWWLLAGAAVVVELLTGTFYLLMIAIGMAAGAIAAHAGGSMTTQLVLAAIVGGGAVVAWHVWRLRHPTLQAAGQAPDGNLDVGQTVQVDVWNPDGTANVRYRGSSWVAACRPGITPTPGPHRVAEVVGSRLIVEKV